NPSTLRIWSQAVRGSPSPPRGSSWDRSWPLTSDSTSSRSPSKRPSRPIWPNATARSAPPPRSATRSRLGWAENGRGRLGEHSQGPSRTHVGPPRAHVGPTQPHAGPTKAHVGPTRAHVGSTQPHTGLTKAHVGPTRAKTVTAASARVIPLVALKQSDDGRSPTAHPRLQGRRGHHPGATGAGVMDYPDSVTHHNEKRVPMTDFTVLKNLQPQPELVRENIKKDPGFGQYFTDHMAHIRYTIDDGWQAH